MILISGCGINGAIDDLAWRLTDTSDTDRMTGQIESMEKCWEICYEKYNVTRDDIAWDTEHEFGGKADNCYMDCGRLLVG